MWCSTCQQDTPGVAHAATGRIVCTRCQQATGSKKPAERPQVCDDGIAIDEQPPPTRSATLFRNDDWPARQRVRNLARELKRPTFAAAKSSSRSTPAERRRFEPPQDLFGRIDGAPAGLTDFSATSPAANAVQQTRQAESSQLVAWLIVFLGSVALAGGIGLIAWSLTTQIMLYWNLAIGLALGGQGTLILGLVLVASRLWRNSRYAAGKLQEVHTGIGQLQQTTQIIATMRNSGGAPAFYADLARGSSPHILLANLKGQVDQLAGRLGR